MTDWGRKMFVTPGVVVDGKLVTNDLVEINLGIRILLGHSYYEDWAESNREVFVTRDPLGNPVDRAAPLEPAHDPQAGDARLRRQVQLDDVAALVRRHRSPRPRHRWWADRPALVDRAERAGRLRLREGDRSQRRDHVAAYGDGARGELRVEDPAVEQRDRAQPGADLLPGLLGCLALYFCEQALEEIRAGHTKTWTKFEVPDEAISVGFTEAVRGVLSHHMVIKNGKIANYHPYPPTPWNGSVRDGFETPGPYEDAVQNTPIFEENPPDQFKGIDIMRAVRSFDPCLPCGVHMYTGGGNVVEQMHAPSMPVKPY